jgi:tRNA threonylcarbamoyladenosine biosynthesis protein TsaB
VSPIRVLAFDTATAATTVALCGGSGEPVAARDDPPAGARPRHTTMLLALIERVLGEADVGWDEIDRIAVGVGPGTFTGLRIGIATAQALGRSRDIELCGVSTLRSLALRAFEADGGVSEAYFAMIDARRREVFAAGWTAQALRDRTAPALLEPLATAPDALLQRAPGLAAGALAVGDGAVASRGALERSGVSIPADGSGLHRADAIGHCRLAAGSPTGDVRPAYLRAPDAELTLRAAQQR